MLHGCSHRRHHLQYLTRVEKCKGDVLYFDWYHAGDDDGDDNPIAVFDAVV